MDEFDKFVSHVRNLKKDGVKQATFDVDYLERVLERYKPTPATVRKIKTQQTIIGDGGRFGDD